MKQKQDKKKVYVNEYLRKENKMLRKKIKELENYVQGMKDLAYYLGGSRR